MPFCPFGCGAPPFGPVGLDTSFRKATPHSLLLPLAAAAAPGWWLLNAEWDGANVIGLPIVFAGADERRGVWESLAMGERGYSLDSFMILPPSCSRIVDETVFCQSGGG